MTFTDSCSVKNHVKNLNVSRVPACPSIFTMTLLCLPSPSSGFDSSCSSRSTPGDISPLGERMDGRMKWCSLALSSFTSSQGRCTDLKSIVSTLRLICSELVSAGGSSPGARREMVIPVLQNCPPHHRHHRHHFPGQQRTSGSVVENSTQEKSTLTDQLSCSSEVKSDKCHWEVQSGGNDWLLYCTERGAGDKRFDAVLILVWIRP